MTIKEFNNYQIEILEFERSVGYTRIHLITEEEKIILKEKVSSESEALKIINSYLAEKMAEIITIYNLDDFKSTRYYLKVKRPFE